MRIGLGVSTVQVIRDDAVDPGAMICVSAKVTL